MKVQRRSTMSEFESALCKVLADEIRRDHRSANTIAVECGITPNALRHMMRGITLMQIGNLHRVADKIGLPLWAIMKAAEARTAKQLEPTS
jgi:hypothetical protein